MRYEIIQSADGTFSVVNRHGWCMCSGFPSSITAYRYAVALCLCFRPDSVRAPMLLA